MALAAWAVVFAAMTDAGNPSVLMGAAVSCGLVCLCSVAGGLVAARITDAASAARRRHVIVVLEGTALTIFFPSYWFAFDVEPVGKPWDFVPMVVLALVPPVFIASALAVRGSYLVHKIVVDASGPLVPDSGADAPSQRIRVLGTVLVVVGVVLSVAAVAAALAAASGTVFYLIFGLPLMITPVLIGMKLAGVTNVYSARRRNVGWYLIVPIYGGFAAAKFASVGGAPGMLFGALACGAIVLLVIAFLMVREYTGLWDRSWRKGKQPAER
jgi:hypothetical protein